MVHAYTIEQLLSSTTTVSCPILASKHCLRRIFQKPGYGARYLSNPDLGGMGVNVHYPCTVGLQTDELSRRAESESSVTRSASLYL